MVNKKISSEKVNRDRDFKELDSPSEIMAALMSDDLSDEERGFLLDKFYGSEDEDEILRVFTDSLVEELRSDKYFEKHRKPTQEEINRLNAIKRRREKDFRVQNDTSVAKQRKRPLSRGLGVAWKVAAVMIPFIVVLGGYLAGWFGNERVEAPQVAEAASVTVYAVEGIQKEVLLRDSSQVWVNSGSRITYPEEFTKEERTVRLEGEAFFAVARNEEKPFVVRTEQLQVRVLGTKFNVSELAEHGKTEVTLHEGLVEVVAGESFSRLTPGQKLTYVHRTGKTTIEEAAKLDDWRSDVIFAERRTAAELLRMVANYYDLTIEFDEKKFSDSELLDVSFGKHRQPEEVIGIISRISNGFEYEIEDNKILIK